MARNIFTLASLFLIAVACSGKQSNSTEIPAADLQGDTINQVPDLAQEDPPAILQDTVGLADSAFVNLAWFGEAFAYDMRYATDNNFTGKTVYPCAVCKIRYAAAKALLRAADSLQVAGGYRIQFFDCYRPVDVQRTFWEIFPNAQYVANPNTSGSVHNRGMAVDITLVDAEGNPLDMGTDFDHFEEEAHHDFTELPEEVLANRSLLKSTMESVGFRSIRTEWWHYNYGESRRYPLANEPLCE